MAIFFCKIRSNNKKEAKKYFKRQRERAIGKSNKDLQIDQIAKNIPTEMETMGKYEPTFSPLDK